MKYLISEIDDNACCEIPRYICNTRADAEEAILSLAQADLYETFVYMNFNDDEYNEWINTIRKFYPEVSCETNYGFGLWLKGGHYLIEELEVY
mgnify:CR=1 FL=1